MSSLLPAKHWEQFGSWLRQMRRALAQAISIDVGEALNKAGFALVDPEGLSYQKGVLVPRIYS